MVYSAHEHLSAKLSAESINGITTVIGLIPIHVNLGNSTIYIEIKWAQSICMAKSEAVMTAAIVSPIVH